MSAQTTSSNNGITFAGLLFIAFLVLKLTHVIDWSWWWVTAPLWVPLAFFVGHLGAVALVALIRKALRRGRK